MSHHDYPELEDRVIELEAELEQVKDEAYELEEKLRKKTARSAEAAVAYASSKDELEHRLENQRNSIRYYQGR